MPCVTAPVRRNIWTQPFVVTILFPGPIVSWRMGRVGSHRTGAGAGGPGAAQPGPARCGAVRGAQRGRGTGAGSVAPQPPWHRRGRAEKPDLRPSERDNVRACGL